MKFELDGREVDSGSYGGATLSQLIDEVEQELAPERVIVSMSLNGEQLDRGAERQNAAMPVERMDSLVINTQQVDTLAYNTLHTLSEYLPQLRGSVEQCVELLQGENESDGHLALGALIEGLQMTSSAWNGISRFLEVDGRSQSDVMPDMSRFNAVITELLRAQQHNDIVQICDLLEFELGPVLQEWEEHAVALKSEIDSPVEKLNAADNR